MKRTLAITALASLSALTLAACASSGEGPTSTRLHGRDRLQSECDARGGFLRPTGHLTGEPALNDVCDVTNSPNPTPVPAP